MQFRARKPLLAMLALLALSAGLAYGQDRSAAILEYFDDELEIQILDAENFEYNNVHEGMELRPGDTIKTFDTTAEIRLESNGSILKLAPDTELSIDSLGRKTATEAETAEEKENEERTNIFSLAVGKLRAVVARAADTAYEFRTPAAVGGVRGTDFGMHVVPDSRDALFVRDGSVSFEDRESGERVVVSSGQIADTFADTFAPSELDQQSLNELFEDLDFQELTPAQVPQESSGDQSATEAPEDGDQQPDEDGPGAERVEPEPGAPRAREPISREDGEQSGFERFMTRVGESLGAETGALTLDEGTYAKIVLQPKFSIGDLEAAMYLPAVYRNNLFDPTSYYRPKGNNEWSFGSDKDWEDDPGDATEDLFTDLALKIRYLRYGERRDPFYLKMGNFDTMTLGHGLIMRNYANDVDFPALRRIGLNSGVDFGGFGMEAAVNDLTEPEIFGARVFTRPLQRTVALGVSAASDIDPAGDIPTDGSFGSLDTNEIKRVDPIVNLVGADIDVSIFETELLTVAAFTDVAGLVPYLSDSLVDTDGETVESGLKTDTFVDTDAGQLRNFGAMTGVLGDIAMFDYRLDFRTHNGLFRPFYFDGGYERRRSEVAAGVYRYFQNPDIDEFQQTEAGIYGEAGFRLFNDTLQFSAGYLWPWEVDSAGTWERGDKDYLTLKAELREGLLPLGIHASGEYNRTGFFATAMSKGDFADATFFDSDSVFRSEIVYPVAPTLDLALTVKTTVLRNEDGTVSYDDGAPEVNNSVTIETRIGL